MWFTSLTLENFRGVKQARVEFGPQLTVLYGPNDLGKSTLVTALRSVLLVPAGSSEGASFVSWYEDAAAPSVTLTFVTDDARHWKAAKRWGPRDSATLSWSKDGVEWLVDTQGRAVDEQLRRLIELGIPSPGGKGAPRGLPTSFLTNALLAGQADVDDVLRQSLDLDPAEGGKVRLTNALSALGRDELFEAVLKQATEELTRHFTATGKARRTQHSPVYLAGEVVKKLSAEADELAAQVGDMATVETSAASLREQRAELQLQVEQAEQVLATVRDGFVRSRGRAALEERLAQARAALRAVDEQVAELATRSATLAQTQRELAAEEQGLGALRAKVEVAARAHEGAEASLRAAQSADGRTKKELERSQLREQVAAFNAARTLVQTRQAAFEEARARVEHAADLEKQVGTHRVELKRLEAVLTEAQAAVTKAQGEVELATGARAYGRWRTAADAQARATKQREEQAALRSDAERARALAASLDEQAVALARELELQRAKLPDALTLTRLQQLEHDLTVARAALGGGVSVTVRARRELSLRTTVDEHRAVDEDRVKGERELEAERRVSLSIGDLVEVEVVAGSAERRREVETLRRRFQAEAVPVLEPLNLTRVSELATPLAAADKRALELTALHDRAQHVRRDAEAALARVAALEEQLVSTPSAEDVASRRARIGGLDVAGLERFVGDLGAAWESMLEALEEQASGALVKATATRDRALRERDVAIERVTQAQARVKELGPVAAPVGEAAALERELRTVATRLAEAEQSLAALSGDDTATIEAQRRAVEVAAAALARAKDDVQVASDTLERNARELQRKLGERDAQRARVEQDRPALAARVTALEGELAAQAVALITQAQVEDAERVLQAARARFDQANEAFHVANGALTRLGGPALREQQHQVLEALKVARTRERALEVDAEAWRLLHETLREAENTAGSHLGRALAAPVEARFVELTRGRYRSLGLGPSLTATTLEVRGVAGHGAEVLDALSVGTRDQLATLVRLAIAAQLHSAIVLDDHLVHTDLTRLDWFNGVLREVATDAQVLVFTCRPHDYLAKAELPTKGAATRDAAGGAVRSVDLEAVVETWPARNKAPKSP